MPALAEPSHKIMMLLLSATSKKKFVKDLLLMTANKCSIANCEAWLVHNAQVFLQAGNSLLVQPGQPKLKVKIKADDSIQCRKLFVKPEPLLHKAEKDQTRLTSAQLAGIPML